MDLQKIPEKLGLSDFPVGLGGCRVSENFFDSCGYDVVVFDDKDELSKIISIDDEMFVLHHGTFSETNSKKLLQYADLQIIQDPSWELRMFLSKIKEKRPSLFADFAKNSLIESMFCCQKTKESIDNSDDFAPCWQKCAAFFLADAITSLNNKRLGPTHMLDSLRKFAKSPINEHISVVTQTVGIERATPVLLERMVKSTMGFSDMIEKNNHSQIIQQKHDYFVKNSMISDCYFYLGYVNKENFIKIKNTLSRNHDLIHVLKTAFDIEADSNVLLHQADLIQNSCNALLATCSE
ncbi:hypothetical protein Nisw_02545 [Candidatus Nitrosopumilus sp. SW]|uniref:hypothetical protein n=1 Tax=Candidatus Nitrosopumilus sp. SW TaxID=2508726 RepID=UPI001154007F|nr:hypothetical protein [Candidatus Nitrosopumilus sp. SW]QDI88488.1 hypothetical protein Nisw_02545 [Candidatus Nitrosopumilus sp. SW]